MLIRAHTFKNSIFTSLVGLALALLIAHAAHAQVELAKIVAGDPQAGDQLGRSVSISGNRAIVGALNEGTAPFLNQAGAAYIYVDNGSGWVQEAKITAQNGLSADRAAGDQFGISVAIDGDVAVIGAWQDTHGVIQSGSAYVYRRDLVLGWQFEAKLLAPDRLLGDRFGLSVAIDGDVIAVGAERGSKPASMTPAQADSGAVYVFRRVGTTWPMDAKLTASNGIDFDGFGETVAVHGDDIIVGARFTDHAAANSGSAYVFHYSGTWNEQGILHASDAAASDNLGWSVSIQGDTAVAGAPLDDHAFTNAGSVYAFTRTAGVWSQAQKLTAYFDPDFDNLTNADFGNSVSLEGNSLAIGSRLFSNQLGAVYKFVRSAGVWAQDSSFFGSESEDLDQFATSVSLSGGILIAGSPGEDDGGLSAGAAYVFDFSASTDSDNDGLDDGDEIAIGTDPFNADTDDDGLGDGIEVALGGGLCPDPLDSDSDDDGLLDGYENDFGPNICDADADDDGLNDGDEITRGTYPTNADSDGDGLNDGAEVALAGAGTCPDPLDSDSDDDGLSDGADVSAGLSPCDSDTDHDTLNDALEIAFGTDGLDSDTDDDGLSDGQEVTLAGGTGCPKPLVADSDDDGLNDGAENGLGLDPCDGDTDGDGLADGNESSFGTNPLNPDSDDDSLPDGAEVTLAAGSGCPSPTDDDSDNDGITDGNELTAGLGPCDTDSDNDGLADGNESSFGTNPLVADSDGDGLLDGTEVDTAMGTGCPNPLNPDSDGDTLSDGAEVGLGTNACNADTDGDGFADNIDPTPTVPGVPPAFLENIARSLADEIAGIDLSEFLGPNNNARQGRQNALANHLNNAANAIAAGNYSAAIAQLTIVLNRVDGVSPQPDWMAAGPEQTSLHAEIQALITLLELLD